MQRLANYTKFVVVRNLKGDIVTSQKPNPSGRMEEQRVIARKISLNFVKDNMKGLDIPEILK